MKKSKILILGLIALLLAGGLVLASCGSKCPDGGDCKFTNPTTVEGFERMQQPKQCSDNCLSGRVSKDFNDALLDSTGAGFEKIAGKTYECDC
jgi:hypothetical protein